MSGKELMELLGDIDDKYIKECEEFKPHNRKSMLPVMKLIATAAIICILIATSVMGIRRITAYFTSDKKTANGQYFDNSGISMNKKYVLWELADKNTGYNSKVLFLEDGTYNGADRGYYFGFMNDNSLCLGNKVENNSEMGILATGKKWKGYILYSDVLIRMLREWEDEDVLIAVCVKEMGGASREEIYEKFVKPLNVHEEFMESGIIYISPKQGKSLTGVKDFSLLLYPASR